MQVLQYRRGDRCSFEPGRCSRSLLGQSVTRQVGAAGRSIAPSSQVLPVIPMPGGERSWRTAATLFLLQLQFFGDCSLDWICNKSELALARFEVGWTAGARNSSATSSSAPVVSFAAAFDKLIVFVSATSWGCWSKHEPAAQVQSSIHASCTVLQFFPPSHSLRTILLTSTPNILRLSVLTVSKWSSDSSELMAKSRHVCRQGSVKKELKLRALQKRRW